ncbi:MAG TPA: hypothetical protein VFN57_10700 [Thermomicrobiaceae bacterium]|nr:hypothetical protein [Thermomicrobiaceae bacterium]
MTKQVTKLTAALALALASLVLLVATAVAAPAASPTALTVTTSPQLDAHGHPLAGQYLLVATLKTSGGQAVANQPVSFYEQVQFVGKVRDALIGTATTDSDGTATMTYQPTVTGDHALLARSTGSAQYAQSQATSTLPVNLAVSPFPVTTEPLAAVRTALSLAVLLVVLAVWAFLIGLAVRAVVGIRSGATAAQPAAWGATFPEEYRGEEARIEASR